MNKGIKISTGDIIGILNSDDIYFPKALEIVNNYFSMDSELDFLFGTVQKHKLMHGYIFRKNQMDIWILYNTFSRFLYKAKFTTQGRSI